MKNIIEAEIKKLLESEQFMIEADEDNEEEKEDKLREMVIEALNQYDLEVNWWEFDLERVYKKGYEQNDFWDDYYIAGYQICFDCDERKMWIEVREKE